jgi:methylaspartate mutase sigma subunit
MLQIKNKLPEAKMEKGKIVVGTIGSDSHSIGQWVLAKYLEEKGFNVVKLGICVSQQEFLDAVIEVDADLVCVSSLYGMGFQDAVGMKERFIEAGKGDVLMYIGGQLEVGSEADWSETHNRFKEIGFDRVYSRSAKLEDIAADIEKDLTNRKRKE